MRVISIVVAMALWLPLSAMGADWPQFLGPDRNAVSPEDVSLARTWPEQGTPVLWTTDVGIGFAGPCVRDGKVYILDRPDREQDVLRCLDLNSGQELWRYAYDAPGKLSFEGSRTTPLATEQRVYTVGPFGHVYCIDIATHEPVWQANLEEDFGSRRPHWGFSHSPLLHGEALIVAPLSKTVALAAFHEATGDLLWKSPPLAGKPGYVSPQVLSLGGKEQIVMATTHQVAGIDPSDGSILWTYDGWNCKIPIPCPVPMGDGRLFITGEYGAGSAMIRVEKTDNEFTATELFKTRECGSQIHQPVLYEGYLYANSNGNGRSDGFICLDLEGKRLWQTGDAPNFERGGLILADGLILNLDGKEGDLRLIEPSPDGYKELATTKVFVPGKKNQIWAPMAIVEGKLLLRDQTLMKCLDVRAR